MKRIECFYSDTILFATGNSNKTSEVRKILGSGFKIIDLVEFGLEIELKEEEETLEGNAVSKARQAQQLTGLNSCFAEDTGLEVDILNGEPGVRSGRYAGSNKDSKANIDKLLKKLEGVESRAARFRTVIAYVSGEESKVFEGIVRGRIGHTPSGRGGFGYDPIFIPEGYSQTFGDLDAEIKNQISHRANAFEKFSRWLQPKTG